MFEGLLYVKGLKKFENAIQKSEKVVLLDVPPGVISYGANFLPSKSAKFNELPDHCLEKSKSEGADATLKNFKLFGAEFQRFAMIKS